MEYRLVPASSTDEPWLEQLRRDVYRLLFDATWGGWDEARHKRHFAAFLENGSISIIEIGGARAGIIQLFDRTNEIEIGEIQIAPSHQNRGIATHILRETIERAHAQRKTAILKVGLKNDSALRLYQRLGFRQTAKTDTHYHLATALSDDVK